MHLPNLITKEKGPSFANVFLGQYDIADICLFDMIQMGSIVTQLTRFDGIFKDEF